MIATKIVHLHISYHTNHTDVLHVGVSPDYYPFTYLNDKNEITGFDIDLIHEIGKRLDKKIELISMQFEALIPSLQLKTIDCLVGGLGITPERQETLAASIPYLTVYSMCIISQAKHRIESLEETRNKPFVVISGYCGYEFLINNAISENISCVKSFADGLLYLDLGKATYFFSDYNNIQSIEKFHEKYSIYLLDNQSETLGIFYHKDNMALKNAVDGIILTMQENNTLERLKKKWNV